MATSTIIPTVDNSIILELLKLPAKRLPLHQVQCRQHDPKHLATLFASFQRTVNIVLWRCTTGELKIDDTFNTSLAVAGCIGYHITIKPAAACEGDCKSENNQNFHCRAFLFNMCLLYNNIDCVSIIFEKQPRQWQHVGPAQPIH